MVFFQREDWEVFLTTSGLSQKSGVPTDRIAAVVIKELTDNALDASGTCVVGPLGNDGAFIEDHGPGIPGTPEEIANLFSIARPLTSSKLLRLPTRGALGNGLRVVAGAVLASEGSLKVRTGGKWLQLYPKDDGTTDVEVLSDAETSKGTRIEVRLGGSIWYMCSDPLSYAHTAIQMKGAGDLYKGKTSALWYDTDAFFELCRAAHGQTVRDLISLFDGFSGARAGKVASSFQGRSADSLSRDETASLLILAKEGANPVKPSRLRTVGKDLDGYVSYAKGMGTYTLTPGRGDSDAVIPYMVEAWASVEPMWDKLMVCVNRTPITGTVDIERLSDKSQIGLFGCGLSNGATVGRKKISLCINITTPFMPITSDGKEPDLSSFIFHIIKAIEKAARSASRKATSTSGNRSVSQKSVVLKNLDKAIEKTSGGGAYRYSVRQLYYSVRPYVLDALGEELTYGNFESIITDHENALGKDLPGIYRDSRGLIYHPHLKADIPLGTLTVEDYRRPDWTFNKVLYIEKEGFFSILKEVEWPERHDCALLTSKGYASRAARDLLDLLGETDEDLLFFCVHDADAAGTMIYQSLQEATKARPGRKVQIINLGLEVKEARQMGLDEEKIKRKDRPVAAYISEENRQWLQDHRFELNAMDTPTFLSWLDKKMELYGNGKVIPPGKVLRSKLADTTKDMLRSKITEKIIREAGIDEKVINAFESIQDRFESLNGNLKVEIQKHFDQDPACPWKRPIDIMAERLSDNAEAS